MNRRLAIVVVVVVGSFMENLTGFFFGNFPVGCLSLCA